MSLRCFGFDSQQASQQHHDIIEKQKVELENLLREKKDEAAASAKEISGLRLRIVALETQLGESQAVKETLSPDICTLTVFFVLVLCSVLMLTSCNTQNVSD